MAGLSQENPLKNVFNPKGITHFAHSIKKVYPLFNDENFIQETLKPFKHLGFLERCHWIKEKLHEFLPQEYPLAIEILLKTLGPELPEAGKTDWDAFIIMPQCAFVSSFGLNHFELSMKALYEMTKRFTAEGELKFFIENHYQETMKILERWCFDPNPHVRRLVSEGTRPRLPLAGRIVRFQKDPKPVIALLQHLKKDPSLYVRRSVANNLNDIAKDNPEIVIQTLKKWSLEKHPYTQWIIQHASRSLIKQGHPEILKLMGTNPEIKITLHQFQLNKQHFKLNDEIIMNIEFEVHSSQEEKLIIDYEIHYIKANLKHKSKVFKLKKTSLQPNVKMMVIKKHKLKNTSGRTHYSGKHFIQIIINGKKSSLKEFTLKI